MRSYTLSLFRNHVGTGPSVKDGLASYSFDGKDDVSAVYHIKLAYGTALKSCDYAALYDQNQRLAWESCSPYA